MQYNIRYKYFYKGMSFRDYCYENRLHYAALIGDLKTRRDRGYYGNLGDCEALNLFMAEYEQVVKILLENEFVQEALEDRDYDFATIISTIVRRNPNPVPVDELVKEAVITIKRRSIFYYNDVLVENACLKYGLNADKVLSKIRCNISLFPEMHVQEVVDKCMKDFIEESRPRLKYKLKGVSLLKVCNKEKLCHQTVIDKLQVRYPNLSEEEMDAAITEVLNEEIKRKKELEEKNNPVRIVIDKGYKPSSKNYVYKIFKKYEIDTTNDENNIKGVCRELRLDYDSFNSLLQYGFNNSQALSILFYFSDIQTKNGNNSITIDRIKVIMDLVTSIKEGISLKKVSLYDLFRVYKCELFDTISLILEKEESYINDVVDSLMRKHQIIDELKPVLTTIVKEAIVLAIDSTYLNREDIVISYIESVVNSKLRLFAKDYDKNSLKYLKKYKGIKSS